MQHTHTRETLHTRAADWQQLAAAVMASAPSDGGGCSGAGSVPGPRSSCGRGLAALLELDAAPAGGGGPARPGSRGAELTVGDLAALRRRHRLPPVAARPAGALEARRRARGRVCCLLVPGGPVAA